MVLSQAIDHDALQNLETQDPIASDRFEHCTGVFNNDRGRFSTFLNVSGDSEKSK